MSNGINYQTINSYVKRHFGAQIKVALKRDVNKNELAVDAFKKTFL
jgi:hypothetical protein